MDVCVGGECTWVVFFCLLLAISECSECSWLHAVCASEKIIISIYIWSRVTQDSWGHIYLKYEWPDHPQGGLTSEPLIVSADGHRQHTEEPRILHSTHKNTF